MKVTLVRLTIVRQRHCSILRLTVMERITIAWDQISSQTIRRSWWKLLPMEELNDERDQEDLLTNTDLVNSFLTLGHEIQMG